jgi:hypothetical protein
MFIWNRSLDRRTFLRGMGATVALPLLDAMIPARTLWAAFKPVPRLAFVYFPHGAIMDAWTPSTAGRDFDPGRILEPLVPFRDRLTIVSGLENRHACGPVHAITPGTWLSGAAPPRLRQGSGAATPRERQGSGAAPPGDCQDSDPRREDDGATADQLAADHLGQDTPLPSIAVATEEPRTITAGIWEGEYDVGYGTSLSFRRAHEPVAMEFRPRTVFETLFHAMPQGQGQTPSSGSILDRVAADVARLRQRLGGADRTVLGEYLDTIRDVECRVDTAEGWGERMRVMFDMIALAFRADITRVATVMMAAETSAVTYDHLGVPEPFHLLSHHQNDPEKIEKLVAIQTWHTRMFAGFVRTLAELPDGDGSLLDRAQVLFGSNMSNSHAHDHFPLPLAVVGGGCGTVCGGQHLRCPDRTPMSNLLVTMLHRSGIDMPSFGDSTGAV